MNGSAAAKATSNDNHNRRRPVYGRASGFTVVELLVTITIIGLLLALLLPAIMSARESARRLTCQNNLKQLMLAVTNYHDVHRAFPPGCVTAPMRGDLYWDEGYGWGVSILPYVDQNALYQELREPFLPGASSPQGTPGVFSKTFTATGRILPGGNRILAIFRCPSSILAADVAESGVSFFDGYGTADYKGSAGPRDTGLFLKVADALRAGSPVIRMRDIEDGPSNTIALGESAYYHTVKHWPVWVGAVVNDESCLFKTQKIAPVNCFLKQKTLQSMLTTSSDDCAFSWHSNGAYFAFADGSVHFLSDDTDATLYENLGDRSDGNTVSLE